jgi:hypothetical protein
MERATPIGTTTYAQNTVWALAGSPHFLGGHATVASRAGGRSGRPVVPATGDRKDQVAGKGLGELVE